MSREIKFRVWEKKLNRFLDWSQKNHLLLTFRDGKIDVAFSALSIDDYVLQQFTGFLDENGREIYEGDIAEYTVEYDTGNQKFIGTIGQENEYSNCWAFRSQGHRTFFSDAVKVKVIGNIFENPELCK
jgi:uncharacterized phage protein (TIGR01671 family)